MRKTFLKITIIITVAFITTACTNVYKHGVDYADYNDKDIPIYDDAVVFEFEGDEEENELVYGTVDDIDDIVEFYLDEFEDDDYIIVEEKEETDEYYLEGYIDNTHFEIEIEEASRDEDEYFDYIVKISNEQVDDEEIEEILNSLNNELVVVVGYDNMVGIGCFNIFDEGSPIRLYYDGEFFEEGNVVQIDGDLLSDRPHDIVVEILDKESNGVVSTKKINGLMYYYAENDGNLSKMPSIYKEAKSLVVDFFYNGENIYSVLYEFTDLEYLALIEYNNNFDLSCLNNNKNLSFLAIQGGVLDHMESLSSLNNLEALILTESDLTDIDFISEITKLKALILEGYFSEISPISGLENLETLILGSSGNFQDITPIHNLRKLNSLSLYGDFVDLTALSELFELEFLELSGEFSDITPLSQLSKLKIISIDGSDDAVIDTSVLDELGAEYNIN